MVQEHITFVWKLQLFLQMQFVSQYNCDPKIKGDKTASLICMHVIIFSVNISTHDGIIYKNLCCF